MREVPQAIRYVTVRACLRPCVITTCLPLSISYMETILILNFINSGQPSGLFDDIKGFTGERCHQSGTELVRGTVSLSTEPHEAV